MICLMEDLDVLTKHTKKEEKLWYFQMNLKIAPPLHNVLISPAWVKLVKNDIEKWFKEIIEAFLILFMGDVLMGHYGF